MKKVSIIVPVYNVEKYLSKCLDSLVNQTLKDIEIIIVNDGSPDNSQKIIDKYKKKYPQLIKTFNKENGGQGSARNLGIEKSNGEYIGFVDSDDYISQDMYEKMYKKAIMNKSDIVVCSNTIVYENNNNEENQPLFIKTESNKVNALFNNAGVCNKLYKSALIKEFSFRNKVWYEDIDFITKVLLKAQKIDFIDEGLYYYLFREGSTMNNNNIIKNLDILLAFDSILSYINENNEYQEYMEEIEYLAINHIYIASIVRVINAKKTNGKKEIISKLVKYMETNFKDYKNNKYLYLLDRNKKIIYNLIKKKLYFFVKVIFLVKGALK